MGKQIAFIMSVQETKDLLIRLQARQALFVDEYFREVLIDELDMDSMVQFYVGYPSSHYQTALDSICNSPNFFTLTDYRKQHQHLQSDMSVLQTAKYDGDKRLSIFTSDVIEITLGGRRSVESKASTYVESRVYIESNAPKWLEKEYNYIANFIRRTACLRHQRALHYVVYISQKAALDMKENDSMIM